MEESLDAVDMELFKLLIYLHRSRATCKKRTRVKSGQKLMGSDVLEEWLLRNKNYPYPSKEQTEVFVKLTHLSKIQIANWFSNARKRRPELKNKKRKHELDLEDFISFV